jgi:hypothetical protein
MLQSEKESLTAKSVKTKEKLNLVDSTPGN